MEMPSRWLGVTRGMSVAVMLGGDNRRYRVSDDGSPHGGQLTDFAGATGAPAPVASADAGPGDRESGCCAAAGAGDAAQGRVEHLSGRARWRRPSS